MTKTLEEITEGSELAVPARVLARYVQPLRVRVLEWVARQPDAFSAKMLAGALDVPIPHAAYHVRTLHADGLIVRAYTTPVRGSVETFYTRNPDAWTNGATPS